MRARRSVASMAAAVLLSGCAETAVVRSYPAGARLYLNNQYVGITPAAINIPREQFDAGQYGYRLEQDGYEPIEGTLRTETCRGRVVGGVFTLGVVLLFKRPTCFASPQDFSLTPLPGSQPVAAQTEHQPTIEERLERLQRLRDDGTISNEEYDHYRQQILNDL